MNVRLLSVSFQLGDLSRNGAIAISVRHGKERKRVTAPEWRADSAERFPSAFTPLDSRVSPVIQAEFEIDPPDTRTVFIGASDPTQANILGSVATTNVHFLKGRSGPVSLPVEGRRLGAVAVHEDQWSWFFLDGGGNEVAITDSKHNIFSILRTPSAPWDYASSDPWLVPWAEALFRACVWADGVTDVATELPRRIAKELYVSGETHPPKFHYRQDAQYASGQIVSLSRLLKYIAEPEFCICSTPALDDRLCGGAINCLDCAAIISVFCNLLGGTSRIARVAAALQNLHLNAVQLIGRLPGSTVSFRQHILTWRDGTSRSELIFDACIGPGGGSADPFAALRFGERGEPDSYRAKVFHRDTEPEVSGPSDPAAVGIEQTRSPLRLLPPVDRSLFGFQSWFGTSRPVNQGFAAWNVMLSADAIPGWTLRSQARFDRKPRPWLTEALWTSEGGDFRTWIFECETREDAHVGLVELLLQEAYGLPERITESPAGDIIFRIKHEVVTSAFFARGNLIVRVVKAPRTSTPVEQLALQLDRCLHDEPKWGKLQASSIGYDEAAIRLPLQPPGEADEGKWFKIYVDRGEIKVTENGAFLYRPLPGKYLARAYRLAGPAVDLKLNAELVV